MSEQPAVYANEERRAKKLAQIRKLLAKADGGTTPEEAQSLREKADALMAQFAVEAWEIKGHDDDRRRPDPISRPMDFNWYVEFADDHRSQMFSMFLDVAAHCRCVVVNWKGYHTSFDRATNEYKAEIIVVGLPADLDYMDLMFTNLLREVSNGLEPKPDPRRPMIENLVRMKEAGMQWQRIADLLAEAGQLSQHEIGGKVHNLDLAGKYTRYCKEHDRPRLKVAPRVYQRSYMYGFADTIYYRLADMRKLQEQGTFMDDLKSATDNHGAALVLQDIRQMVKRKAEEMFPRPEAKVSGRAAHGRTRSLKTSEMARSQGSEAGAKAKLTPDAAGEVGTTKKELNRG